VGGFNTIHNRVISVAPNSHNAIFLSAYICLRYSDNERSKETKTKVDLKGENQFYAHHESRCVSCERFGVILAMKPLEVVAAIIIENERFLCVQRDVHEFSYISKKYEFPGGKIESGESHVQALSREIAEELNLDIKIGKHFLTNEHEYPGFTLLMHSYLCVPLNIEALKLSEHVDLKWLPVSRLEDLDWAAADIPIVEQLKAHFHEYE
jgi:8-oxo-dGTP diphosphatase